MQMKRIRHVMRVFGYSTRTSVYDAIRKGLLTEPVALSARTRGWPDYEIAAIFDARVAGASEERIAQLVQSLYDARRALAAKLEGGTK